MKLVRVRSIFGVNVDLRCLGCGFLTKLLVFLGLMADNADSVNFSQVDIEEDFRGRCFLKEE
jgi:hypothetical protein